MMVSRCVAWLVLFQKRWSVTYQVVVPTTYGSHWLMSIHGQDTSGSPRLITHFFSISFDQDSSVMLLTFVVLAMCVKLLENPIRWPPLLLLTPFQYWVSHLKEWLWIMLDHHYVDLPSWKPGVTRKVLSDTKTMFTEIWFRTIHYVLWYLCCREETR